MRFGYIGMTKQAGVHLPVDLSMNGGSENEGEEGAEEIADRESHGSVVG
jgi:hypothetical protein